MNHTKEHSLYVDPWLTKCVMCARRFLRRLTTMLISYVITCSTLSNSIKSGSLWSRWKAAGREEVREGFNGQN